MGGYSIEDDMENFPSALTLVLVGRTGNGKSATGNSIIGSKEFESKRNSGAVTVTSKLKTTKLDDGMVLNVIDTPGLFDSSADSDFIGKEIVGCLNMARDGIHGVLVVYSVLTRFSEEERAVISNLGTLFGSKVYDYVTIVFTGGDVLEEEGKTLEDFLRGCPEALKEVLFLCGHRYVLFDNKTNDQTKKVTQLQQLLSYVKEVLEKNGGRPYANEIFTELKKQIVELKEEMEKLRGVNASKQFSDLEILERIELLRDKQLERIMEPWESKFKEIEARYEKLFKEEEAQWESKFKEIEVILKLLKEEQAQRESEFKEIEARFEKLFKEEEAQWESKFKEIKVIFEKLLKEEQAQRESEFKEIEVRFENLLTEEQAQTQCELEFKEIEVRFEKLLKEEQAAREKAVNNAKKKQKKFKNELKKLKEELYA